MLMVSNLFTPKAVAKSEHLFLKTEASCGLKQYNIIIQVFQIMRLVICHVDQKT